MSDYSSMSVDDILSSIEVMRMQEETGYTCHDYLYQQQPQLKSFKGPQSEAPIDAECRCKMTEWCYQVVDFCKFSRETVAIATSYLDRYLATEFGRTALNDRKTFQLAAMTCLYTAIKIHEPEAMEPKIVAGLSRGAYTEKEVTDMEMVILTAIKWRVNPPTALSFVHSFFAAMPSDIMTEVGTAAMYELAKFQTELAVNDYSFVTVNASTIAVASVLNALQSAAVAEDVETDFRDAFTKVASISSETLEAQEKLYLITLNSTTGRASTKLAPKASTPTTIFEKRPSSVHVSPRCVATRQ